MSVLVGLDVGTGGARAVAETSPGRWSPRPLQSTRYKARVQAGQSRTPQTGGREPERRSGGSPPKREVAGIGLTGQMHGSVFLDSSDGVIRPALLWNDQRTYSAVRRDNAGSRRRTPDLHRGQPRADGLPGSQDLSGSATKSRRTSAGLPPRAPAKRLREATGSPASTPRTPRTRRAPCSSTCAPATGRVRSWTLWRSRTNGCPKSTRGPRTRALSVRTWREELGLPAASPSPPAAATTRRRPSGQA